MNLWHGDPPTLLPNNPQPTGDDDARNLIPLLVTNHPEQIHPSHSFTNLRPSAQYINVAQILLLPAAGLRQNPIHKSSPTQTKKSTKQAPDHQAFRRPKQSKISYPLQPSSPITFLRGKLRRNQPAIRRLSWTCTFAAQDAHIERKREQAGFLCTNLDSAQFFVLFFGLKFEESENWGGTRASSGTKPPSRMKTSLANLHRSGPFKKRRGRARRGSRRARGAWRHCEACGSWCVFRRRWDVGGRWGRGSARKPLARIGGRAGERGWLARHNSQHTREERVTGCNRSNAISAGCHGGHRLQTRTGRPGVPVKTERNAAPD